MQKIRLFSNHSYNLTGNNGVIEIPLFDNEKKGNLKAFLSTRSTGDMRREKSSLFDLLSIDSERVVFLKQVHSKKVLLASEVSVERYGKLEGDGLVCIGGKKILGVSVADCLPIFIIDKKTGTFGVVHSGWKGTGIVIEAVRVMREKVGSKTDDLRVVIGPGIGACCYDVPRERFVRFAKDFGNMAARKNGGKYYLDLRTANFNLLLDAGVKDIVVVEDCTSCTPQLWSFRRDGPDNFGTMFAMIGFF